MKIDKGGIINDFIEPNKKQYVIPVYQRNYEWSENDCKKLFDDIIDAHLRDSMHFCGSIVYAPLKDDKKINYYVIVDGQQRLTTIFLLIKALADESLDEASKSSLLECLANTDKFNRYGFDEASKLKLKPIKSDNRQLMLLMEGDIGSMDKSCGLYRNYALFRELIRNFLESNPGMGVSNIYDGIEHLTCAVIKLEEDDDESPQQIFERINSTGKPLQLTDKIRNFVLMTDQDQERLYEDCWLKIEQLLTKEQLEDFFLAFLNMKGEGFAKWSTAYDLFKRLFSTCGYTNESMLTEMLHYAKQYAAFFYGDRLLGDEANASLEGLRNLKQSTVCLFLFHVFDDFESERIDKRELAKVLNLLLSYSVRRLVCEVGSNSLRGLYKTLYSRVFADPKNKDCYYDAIVSFLQQLLTKDAMPSDADFAAALKEHNLYNKRDLCKYLLVAVENQGKEKLVTDNLTIEHIMPQNKNLSTDWQNMLGADWESVRERYLHTLGNLTLTGYNSELGDKPFAVKKRLIEEKGSHMTVLYSDVRDKETWNENAIVARANRVGDAIVKLFAIEQPKERVEFVDTRYKLYTAADPSHATYKHVNYYELLGERVIVDTFAEMVHSVVERLYRLRPDVIEGMARGNETFPGGQAVPFSYDAASVRKGKRISDGLGIYFATGWSAKEAVAFIGECLKKYDLSLEDDFAYSARPTVYKA